MRPYPGLARVLRCLPLWLVLCLVLAGQAAQAAQAAPPRTLRFEQLSVADGLPQESVLAIAQDRQGFIWFGTQAGLARFDGYRTVTYQHALSDPHSLAENWVRVLHVDPSGRLWVGTDNGLDLFDPLTQRFTHYRPSEPEERGNGNRHVRAIVDDGVGGLWLATADGLQRFDPATGRYTIWHNAVGDPHSLIHDQINALARDAAGRLWIGTPAGVDMLAPGATRFVHYPANGGAGGRTRAVQALLADREGTLWVGTHAGMERWQLGPPGQSPRRERVPDKAGLPAATIMSAYQDADGTVWIGTRNDGLYRWQPETGRFASYRHEVGDPHSLADDYVSALFRDRVGTFWVGTWYNGVSRVDLASGGFSRLVKDPDRKETLSDNRVRTIVAADDGKLWIGNDDGLSLYDPVSGASRLYALPMGAGAGANAGPGAGGGAGEGHVTALWREPGGTLWVGSRTGVRTFDPATGAFGPLLLSRGNPELDTVRHVYGDRAGMVWVSSKAGLYRLDPASGGMLAFRHDPNDAHSLADNTARPVLEDSAGNLWVGTFNGLDLLDRRTGRFRHFRHDPNDPASLSHNEVHYLYEDGAGTLWVGTASGLNRMRRGPDGISFRRYTRHDGIADDSIAAILPDRQGKLWLSTNIGLTSLDPATGRVRNYSGADGTIEGAYFDGSALAARDGTLYFGGFNGITAFDPAAVRPNGIAPAVAITDFQIFNASLRPGVKGPDGGVTLHRAIEATRELALRQQDSVFSLEFAALHYASPQNNRFAYQLEGFDRDWVITSASKRFATYTNLDPGRYVFRVKAANKDGVWGEPTVLAITILPPVWKTWWFRALALLLVLGGGYGLYRARVRVLSGQRTRLEQQVSLRTAEVEMKNRLLMEQKRELEQRDERLSHEKRRAEDATRQKSEFLANMSHEMRTPLAGVIGMLGFALRDPTLQAATREQIERGQANAQALLSIINDLLDFSKIEAGKLTIEKIDFSLAAAVENVVSLFEEQAAAQGVEFRVEYARDLPHFVVGDPLRLRQVLVNLVGNAFKFTQRGHVTLRVARLGSTGAGCALIGFTVEDTGIGIPPAELPRLFEKFEQADATTTRRYGGTGLGLAICRQLVELMGGEIGAVSSPEEGSVFSFTLPLCDGVPPPLAPQVPRAPHSHRLKVLCAEDFPTNQIIIRMMLEDLGHSVDIVGNGALAVSACASTRYDLILMDGRMPEMDGPAATRLIRAGGPPDAPVRDPDLMIIALTANVSEEDRSRYLGSGMNDFLTKPIDEGALHLQLTRAIERQLRRGVALEPMPADGHPARPSVAELDAMFGVDTGLPPLRRPLPAVDQDAANALRLRLRDAFIADLPGRLDELDAALAAADADAAGRLFHGMKGSAAYLQEAELHALCAELERAADRALWQAIQQKLPRLHAMLGRILTPAGASDR